jgi:hypothetical protein
MPSSNYDQSVDIRDALAITRQTIRDFQSHIKKLLRLDRKEKISTELAFLTSTIGAIEENLQQFDSNVYLLSLRNSLTLLLQVERKKIIHLNATPSKPNTEVDIFASVLQAMEEGIKELSLKEEELQRKQNANEKSIQEKLLKREKENWKRRAEQIEEGQDPLTNGEFL